MKPSTLSSIICCVSIFLLLPAAASAQAAQGTIRFSGTLQSVEAEGNIVLLTVGIFDASVLVELDEHGTVTGSLGGNVSAAGLTPGASLEVEGQMRSDGSIRASTIQIKVQAGTLRMAGLIDNILETNGSTSVIVSGVEFRLDPQTGVVVNRDGLAASGSVSDLAIGNEVDITGSRIDVSGVGSVTSVLFRASRVVVYPTFRLQGVIGSRIPALGTPTVIVVEGIAITITPETNVVRNGMNERNEAFLASELSPLIRGVEDDAGNPCEAPRAGIPNDCPDIRPADPTSAGDLALGTAVRIEGLVENTGFSPRYTARTVQVEQPSQLRFQATVVGVTAELLSLRINGSIQTQVVLNKDSRLEGDISPGRLVEVSAHFNPDLSMVARRVKVVP